MLLLVVALLASTSPTSDRESVLDRFAGHWELRGQSRGDGSTSTYEVAEDCHRSGGRAFMICEQAAHGHPISDVTIVWWDANAGLYRFTGLNKGGSANSGTIAIAGDRWTWNSVAGRSRFRTINRWTSRNRIAYIAERSLDGGANWTVTGHGSETRNR